MEVKTTQLRQVTRSDDDKITEFSFEHPMMVDLKLTDRQVLYAENIHGEMLNEGREPAYNPVIEQVMEKTIKAMEDHPDMGTASWLEIPVHFDWETPDNPEKHFGSVLARWCVQSDTAFSNVSWLETEAMQVSLLDIDYGKYK